VLAAQQGLATAVVEKGSWGGACLNRGCVPKKIWYHTACLASDAARLMERGVRGRLEVDAQAAWRHQRAVVEGVRASYLEYLQRLGVSRFVGHARLVGKNRVEVNRQRLETAHIVIATGSRPQVPPQLPSGAPVLSTDQLFEQPLPPGKRVALVGGGAAGVELAFILPHLGFEVTWHTRREPLAGSRFSDAGKQRLAEALRAQGVSPAPLTAGIPACDWMLAATGRAPNTEELGLEEAGVQSSESRYILVDDRQHTSAPGVFAIGDCATPAMTANHALAQAEVVVANIVRAGSLRADPARVPTVLHTALELACVGATEDELEDAGAEYAVGFSSFTVNPGALADTSSDGYVRLLVDREHGTLLGCEIAGRQAGELISLAYAGGTEPLLSRLRRMPFNHPARSETFQGAAEQLSGQWGLGAPRAGPE
jgi:dihydrolipoamide dehydrogenase